MLCVVSIADGKRKEAEAVNLLVALAVFVCSSVMGRKEHPSLRQLQVTAVLTDCICQFVGPRRRAYDVFSGAEDIWSAYTERLYFPKRTRGEKEK
ncbi:uncharacterized protein SPSK_03757 [Sporothrix schenckii 1099-18]|uniref:Uncharacterized protein n=1 Tax=Sporothrix schenckii 1099-18 TaxID=1397361 RepID=A0A0F2LZK1_SPOSC|nr:uncharacterized protein SPSK_03757 [Sporothrix schenckii 1099-18]KJR82259.1 hypothetical protein SPSK_03757 [Sporothrix schenckii 1099-18]